MKQSIKTLVLTAFLGLAGSAVAQDAPQLAQLGVDQTTSTKALDATCAKSNQTGSLERMKQSLNEHLMVAFQRTAKFKLIAKSDLGKLLADQQIPPDLIRDPSDNKSLPGRVKGLDYLMVPTLTDFIDASQGTFIEGMGMRVDKRNVRATAVVKIYNATTGVMLSAVTIPVALDEAVAARVPREGYNTRTVDDSLIEAASIMMAERASMRVVDTLYPPRVVAITGDQVTINRGEGSGVEIGQVFDIYALGDEMFDPDSGGSLGREEIRVGQVIITSITPKTCKATLRGNNLGVTAGAVARLVLTPPPGMDDMK